MSNRLLITSFDIWEAHHISNASDDLLAMMGDRLPPETHVLRKLPVDFQVAPAAVIAAMATLQPDIVLCCGMAESRTTLTLEANGKCQEDVRPTAIALSQLLPQLPHTHISHDAGNFVCNHLYYTILQHIHQQRLASHCLFLHVPLLTAARQASIVSDFATLLQCLHHYAGGCS